MGYSSALVTCLATAACLLPAMAHGARPGVDGAGWQVAPDASWVEAGLLHKGYIAVVRGTDRMYCRREQSPRLGSRLNSRIFCTDADSLQLNYLKHG